MDRCSVYPPKPPCLRVGPKRHALLNPTYRPRLYRYPKSFSYVVMDALEKLYLAGFPVLLIFVSVFPLSHSEPGRSGSSTCSSTDAFACPEPGSVSEKTVPALEFLPLMLTSIYCALGLVWSFLRLGFIYLQEETKYQGQLSEVK